MIVEKYMCIGITSNINLVEDVQLHNINSNQMYNEHHTGFRLNILKNYDLFVIKTDNKKFDNKQDAINHIFSNLKSNHNYSNVMNWSVITVYEDIYDIVQQRKYKIKKLIKK